MSALKMRSEVTSHQKLTTTSWEDHQSWSSYNNTRSCQRAQHQPFYSHSAFEANWKSEIAWYVGISWADCKSKKSSFWSAVFFYCMQQEQTISGSDCDTQWTVHFIWQSAMTSSGVGPRRSSKALPKAKKGHGHCLMACCPSDSLLNPFWILTKPLHLRTMLSKSMRCTENGNICSQRWSTELAQFFPTTMPDGT